MPFTLVVGGWEQTQELREQNCCHPEKSPSTEGPLAHKVEHTEFTAWTLENITEGVHIRETSIKYSVHERVSMAQKSDEQALYRRGLRASRHMNENDDPTPEASAIKKVNELEDMCSGLRDMCFEMQEVWQTSSLTNPPTALLVGITRGDSGNSPLAASCGVGRETGD